MRSKFSDLINQGVADFTYINTISDKTDPICVEYNNLFSILTDTHMEPYGDGYIITGSKYFFNLASNRYDPNNYNGYYNIFEFFNKYNLIGTFGKVNGDDVYILSNKPNEEIEMTDINCPTCYYADESRIPHPMKELVIDGDINKIKECFNNSENLREIAEKLNDSPYIKGEWICYNDKIYGKVNNKNIII